MMSNIYLNAQRMKAEDRKGTYGDVAAVQDTNFFSPIISTITDNQTGQKYSSVAPAAVLNAMVLVAGACIHAADAVPSGTKYIGDRLGMEIKGIFCAICVVISGSFAVLEYLISFMEFMFICSVGIILFPLSLWDGTKFMAEKLISAIMGFFIKLLFSSICVFISLYGYMSLATLYTKQPFLGLIDQMLMVIFTSLMFYYLSKSAPHLAQSLLTGAPSLTAAGAIGTVVTAFGAVAGAAGIGAQIATGGVSALAKAGGAASAASSLSKEGGGSSLARGAAGVGAFAGSLVSSGVDTVRSAGNSLTRSLINHSPFYNSSSTIQNALSSSHRFMRQESMADFVKDEASQGKDMVNSFVRSHGETSGSE